MNKRITKKKRGTIPCHKKMHSHKEYAEQQWDLIQQQMPLVQKQVYRLIHTVSPTKRRRELNFTKKIGGQ